MSIVTVGIDLAKNVFAVHGADEAGKPMLVRPEVARAKLLELIANLPPSPSTHNQALSDLLFLYREVLNLDFTWMDGINRPASGRSGWRGQPAGCAG